MLQFECHFCHALVKVEDDRAGKPVTCTTCNTRQLVPDGAVKVPGSPEPADTLPHPRQSPELNFPDYPLVLIAGWCILAAGAVIILIALYQFLKADSGAERLSAFSGLVSGLVTMGFGQLLHCVRDIARNSWRGRAT